MMCGTLSSKMLSFLFTDSLHMDCHLTRNLGLLRTKINRKVVYQSNLRCWFSEENNDRLLDQLALINSKKRIRISIGSNFQVKGYNLIPEIAVSSHSPSEARLAVMFPSSQKHTEAG